ncbi:hypothetical protein Sango_2082100 [Sesamum angolense]|uniref:RNase H type-1 domain-containing protein n=1 Tax=Sesamum angolense TaxID=2727404 RepID=A0AAE1WBE0_9LAMI|nr:hypothetical protein Sango_2082100 [Sesamum angolense]
MVPKTSHRGEVVCCRPDLRRRCSESGRPPFHKGATAKSRPFAGATASSPLLSCAERQRVRCAVALLIAEGDGGRPRRRPVSCRRRRSSPTAVSLSPPDVAEPFIFWILGDGSIFFWHDNWLGKKPLAQLLHRDAYTLAQKVRGIRLCGRGLVRGVLDKIDLGGYPDDLTSAPAIGTCLASFSVTNNFNFLVATIPKEMISHLFVESTAVQGVWQHFADRFGLPLCDTGDLTHMFSTNSIIIEVQRHLHTLYVAGTLTSTQWKGDLHRAGAMGFVFRQTLLRALSVVHWSTPSPTWFKLNTDGCSLRNPSPAGVADIIRDSDGCIHLTFQVTLGAGTRMIFEHTTVWRCLELALAHTLAPLVVEVDAKAVIQLLQSRVSGKWREANGAADHLAKEAASLQLNWVLRNSDITGRGPPNSQSRHWRLCEKKMMGCKLSRADSRARIKARLELELERALIRARGARARVLSELELEPYRVSFNTSSRSSSSSLIG